MGSCGCEFVLSLASVRVVVPPKSWLSKLNDHCVKGLSIAPKLAFSVSSAIMFCHCVNTSFDCDSFRVVGASSCCNSGNYSNCFSTDLYGLNFACKPKMNGFFVSSCCFLYASRKSAT